MSRKSTISGSVDRRSRVSKTVVHGRSPGLSWLGRGLAVASIAGLTVFHGHLLVQRVADLSLLDPLVAARWAVTALLVAGAVHLQRSGISLFRGRKALVLWLLALLLHTGTVPPVDGRWVQAAEAGLLLALPFWGQALVGLFGGRVRRASAPGRAQLLSRLAEEQVRWLGEPEFLDGLSPRPPPAVAFL